MTKQDTGKMGEKLACEFLGRNGYDIVETNYRCPEGEIDIVACQQNTLVFVEVRTKTSRLFGQPEESITPAKASLLLDGLRVRGLTQASIHVSLSLISMLAVAVTAVRLGMPRLVRCIKGFVE